MPSPTHADIIEVATWVRGSIPSTASAQTQEEIDQLAMRLIAAASPSRAGGPVAMHKLLEGAKILKGLVMEAMEAPAPAVEIRGVKELGPKSKKAPVKGWYVWATDDSGKWVQFNGPYPRKGTAQSLMNAWGTNEEMDDFSRNMATVKELKRMYGPDSGQSAANLALLFGGLNPMNQAHLETVLGVPFMSSAVARPARPAPAAPPLLPNRLFQTPDTPIFAIVELIPRVAEGGGSVKLPNLPLLTVHKGMGGRFAVQLPGESMAAGQVFQRKSGKYGVALFPVAEFPGGWKRRMVASIDVPRKSFATPAEAIAYIEAHADREPAAPGEPFEAKIRAIVFPFARDWTSPPSDPQELQTEFMGDGGEVAGVAPGIAVVAVTGGPVELEQARKNLRESGQEFKESYSGMSVFVLDRAAPAAPAAAPTPKPPAPAPAPAKPALRPHPPEEVKVRGHYEIQEDKTYADSGVLQTAGSMPGASVEHMGFGEFYVQTPQGRIDFHRRDSMAEDFPEFSGRVHYVTGDPVAALAAFTEWMEDSPEIVETGVEVEEIVAPAPAPVSVTTPAPATPTKYGITKEQLQEWMELPKLDGDVAVSVTCKPASDFVASTPCELQWFISASGEFDNRYPEGYYSLNGPTGEHPLNAATTNIDRLWEHWTGYVDNSRGAAGIKIPEISWHVKVRELPGPAWENPRGWLKEIYAFVKDNPDVAPEIKTQLEALEYAVGDADSLEDAEDVAGEVAEYLKEPLPEDLNTQVLQEALAQKIVLGTPTAWAFTIITERLTPLWQEIQLAQIALQNPRCQDYEYRNAKEQLEDAVGDLLGFVSPQGKLSASDAAEIDYLITEENYTLWEAVGETIGESLAGKLKHAINLAEACGAGQTALFGISESEEGELVAHPPTPAALGDTGLPASYPPAPVPGGTGSGAANAKYLDSLPPAKKAEILKHIATHYDADLSYAEIEDEVTDSEAEALYEYITDNALRVEVAVNLHGVRSPIHGMPYIDWLIEFAPFGLTEDEMVVLAKTKRLKPPYRRKEAAEHGVDATRYEDALESLQGAGLLRPNNAISPTGSKLLAMLVEANVFPQSDLSYLFRAQPPEPTEPTPEPEPEPDVDTRDFRDLMVAGSFGAFTTPGIVDNTFDYLGNEIMVGDNHDGTFRVSYFKENVGVEGAVNLGSFSDAAAATQAVQAAIAPAAPTPTYFKGDKARYTGKSEVLHGGRFYEVVLVEGHRKGEKKWVHNAPGANITPAPAPAAPAPKKRRKTTPKPFIEDESGQRVYLPALPETSSQTQWIQLFWSKLNYHLKPGTVYHQRSREVRVEGYGDSNIYINYFNLPQKAGVGFVNEGAEAENNRLFVVVELLYDGRAKLTVEIALQGAPKLRGRTSSAEKIATYLAEYLSEVATWTPPRYTHSTPPSPLPKWNEVPVAPTPAPAPAAPSTKLIQVEVHELYALPQPLVIESQGEENVYFYDPTGQRYFLKFDAFGSEIEIIKSLGPGAAATPAPQKRSEWSTPQGTIRVVEGAQGRRATWHNIHHGGTRYGYDGKRWARGKEPSQAILDAVAVEGWGHLFGIGPVSVKRAVAQRDEPRIKRAGDITVGAWREDIGSEGEIRRELLTDLHTYVLLPGVNEAFGTTFQSLYIDGRLDDQYDDLSEATAAARLHYKARKAAQPAAPATPAPAAPTVPLSEKLTTVQHGGSESYPLETRDKSGNELRVWIERKKNSTETRLVRQRFWKGRWANPKKNTYMNFGALAVAAGTLPRVGVYYVSARSPEAIGISPVGETRFASGESYKQGTSYNKTGPKTPGYDAAAALLDWSLAFTDEWAARYTTSRTAYESAEDRSKKQYAADAAEGAAGTWTPKAPLPSIADIKKMRVGDKLKLDGPVFDRLVVVTKKERSRWYLNIWQRDPDGVFLRSPTGPVSIMAVGKPSPTSMSAHSPEEVEALLKAFRASADGTFTAAPAPAPAAPTKGRFSKGQTLYSGTKAILVEEDVTAELSPTAAVKEYYRVRVSGRELHLTWNPALGIWKLRDSVGNDSQVLPREPTPQRTANRVVWN